MTAGYDGQQISGMDLYRHRSVLVSMTADGERLNVARIGNSPARLPTVAAACGHSPKVLLKVTYGDRYLSPTSAPVHLAHR